jgi:hypothetical protein
MDMLATSLMVLSTSILGGQPANVQDGGTYSMTKGPKQSPSKSQVRAAWYFLISYTKYFYFLYNIILLP